MNIYKKIAASIFAVMAVVAMSTTHTFAQTDIADIRNQIADLKEEHKELRAAVEAGELTREEAIDMWSEKIAEIRNLKEALFDSRIENLNERYEAIAQNNPERAEALEQFLTGMMERRETVKVEREALHAAVKAGEITRAEAYQERRVLHEQARAEREFLRGNFKQRKGEIKVQYMDKRQASKDMTDMSDDDENNEEDGDTLE
jgi:hypothetical protein